MSLQPLPSAPTTADHPSADTHVMLLASGTDLPRLATERDPLLTLQVCKANQQASPTAM